jgi:parallel beta helix pectate lyase-like protein
MAISSNTNWEVRTAGNDNNGGGFVSGATGTDYSQQNAAQYTFTDLASTNGTTNPSQVSSASHSFVAADVGNIIQITAGTNFTAGFYQIVSVAGGAATLDRAVGTAATLTGGTYAVGGALLTPAKAFAACNAGTAVTLTPGQIVWIKAGTYTLTSTIHITSPAPVNIIGYDTTRGDDTGTKPLITTSTNSVDLIKYDFNIQNLQIDNINFSNTAVTPGIGIWSNFVSTSIEPFVQIRRCKFTGFTIGFNANNGGAESVIGILSMVGCEIANCTSYGIQVQLQHSTSLLFGCYIHDNGAGLAGAGGGASFTASNAGRETLMCINSIFDANTGYGLSLGAAPLQTIKVYNCNFTNNTTSGMVTNDSNTPANEVYNCIFYGNTGAGYSNSGANSPANVLGFNNAFGANGSTFLGISNSSAVFLGVITLTANPFNGTTDFTLNTTAGGGALLTGKAFPAAFGTTTVNKANVGAVQSNGSSGGGATSSPFAYIQ